MFNKYKLYYSVEVKDDEDDAYIFICSYSTFSEARQKLDELELNNDDKVYRILKIEKSIEEVS